MESLVSKKHRLKDISREFPYACRYPAGPAALKDSLARHGLLMPVLVLEEEGKAPVLISGHARFQAACELSWDEIPALAIQYESFRGEAEKSCIKNEISPPFGRRNDKHWYLFSILSNWNQVWSDLDRAFAVHRAKQLGFSEQEILEDILLSLGLAPERKWIDEAAAIMSLAPEVLKAVSNAQLPYRGIRSLSVFSLQDQRSFVLKLAGLVFLTSNQLMKISEWLHDLLKSRKGTMENLLASPDVEKVISRAEWNPRQKGELFCHLLRTMRYPEQVSREEKFASAADRLAQEARSEKSEFTLEAPPFFEAEGITLRARLKDPAALDRMIEVIQRKRNLFNSLFDIVL